MLFCPPAPAPSGHPSVPAVGMLFAGTRTRETANAICRECLSRIEKDTKEVLDSEKESYYSKNYDIYRTQPNGNGIGKRPENVIMRR